MKLIGTITSKDDEHSYIASEAETYGEAKSALFRLIPETHQLTAIRVVQEH